MELLCYTDGIGGSKPAGSFAVFRSDDGRDMHLKALVRLGVIPAVRSGNPTLAELCTASCLMTYLTSSGLAEAADRVTVCSDCRFITDGHYADYTEGNLDMMLCCSRFADSVNAVAGLTDLKIKWISGWDMKAGVIGH